MIIENIAISSNLRYITSMTKNPKRPRDQSQLAKLIVDISTGEVDDDDIEINVKKQKAGKKGARARSKSLTPEQRAEIAHIAAQARWKKGD